jgi:hypothetical protein
MSRGHGLSHTARLDAWAQPTIQPTLDHPLETTTYPMAMIDMESLLIKAPCVLLYLYVLPSGLSLIYENELHMLLSKYGHRDQCGKSSQGASCRD